jgi:hypothetical protein
MKLENLHQTSEQIIAAASPEQRLIWNYLFLTFGERMSIGQLFFQGGIAGTEFLTYVARTLYFALEISGSATGAAGGTPAVFAFYNENNVVSTYLRANGLTWLTSTLTYAYIHDTAKSKNLYFSRIVASNYTAIKFIGYRITY